MIVRQKGFIIFGVVLGLLLVSTSSVNADSLYFDKAEVLTDVSKDDGIKVSEENNYYYEDTVDVYVKRYTNNGDTIFVDVTVVKDISTYDNGGVIRPFTHTGTDSSKSVRTTITTTYSNSTKNGKPVTKITKTKVSWNLLDKTVKLSGKNVKCEMVGSTPVGKGFVYSSEKKAATTTTNSLTYEPKFKWYRTEGTFMAGCDASVTLKRGSSTWTYTIRD